MLSRPSTSTGARRGLLAAWLIPAVLALVLNECQPLHVHADQRPGLYNESHVLTALATPGGGALVPGPAPQAWPPPALACALPGAIAAVPAVAGSTADSRAPPLA